MPSLFERLFSGGNVSKRREPEQLRRDLPDYQMAVVDRVK